MRKSILTFLCVLSLLIASAPLVCVQLGLFDAPNWILVLFSVSWVLLFVFFLSSRRMIVAIDSTMQSMGLGVSPGSLEAKFDSFLNESARHHRAAFAFRSTGNVYRANLGSQLHMILELAFRELHARAVQLSLHDENSSAPSQTMFIGDPINVNSRVGHDDSDSRMPTVLPQTERSGVVIRQTLSFAGITFGTLLVEFEALKRPTESDLQVVQLLATQGALMLVDARFTEEILKMKRAGEESVQAKTGFLANLSHEIRGPLGIMLNATELVIEGLCGPVSETQKETLSMIQTNGSHLLDLVNDVLDYAKVEAGKVIAKPVAMPVYSLIEDLAMVVRSQAVAKKHKLVVTPMDKQLAAICDKRHARQVLINFLTNAIKYTPPGGEITISAERLIEGRVKIAVRDTGVGIADDQRSKVFGAFERVADEYSLKQSGTGLGMPLAKRLAEVNGGSTDFESTPGLGSTFWFILPSVELPEVENQSVRVVEGKLPPQGRGEVVLLVDSDVETRSILEKYLMHQGFEVFSAATQREAMKVLKEHEVKLAIVDNDLTGCSGEELVSGMRAMPRFSNIAIIMLSARAFVFDIEHFLKLGVDRCMAKPVDMGELAFTTRQLIDQTSVELRP